MIKRIFVILVFGICGFYFSGIFGYMLYICVCIFVFIIIYYILFIKDVIILRYVIILYIVKREKENYF